MLTVTNTFFSLLADCHALLHYGAVSTPSSYTTKRLHTRESGAITNDDLLAERLASVRSFGHAKNDGFGKLGISAKSTELHAALGWCMLLVLLAHPRLSAQHQLPTRCCLTLAAEEGYHLVYSSSHELPCADVVRITTHMEQYA